MKSFILSILCIIGMTVYAAEFAPVTTPATTMQSVNNSGYMATGSAYSSAVYEVGANSPTYAPASGPRKVGGLGTDETGFQGKENPNFGPVGDALIPLLLIALAYTAIRAHRKKRLSEHTSNS